MGDKRANNSCEKMEERHRSTEGRWRERKEWREESEEERKRRGESSSISPFRYLIHNTIHTHSDNATVPAPILE